MESPLPMKCRSRQLDGSLIDHSWDLDGMKGPQMLLTPEEEVAASFAICGEGVNRLAG